MALSRLQQLQKLKAMKEQLNTKIAANEVKITELREKDANEENRERLPGGSNVARHHQKLNLQAEAELEEAKRSILEVQNAIADKLGGNEQDVPCPPRRLEFIRPVALSSDAALALQPASSSALGLAGLAPAALATAIRSGVVSSIAQRYAAKPDADAAVLEDLFVQLVRLTAAAADPGTSSAAARTAHALLQSLPDGSRTLSAACFLEALETLGFSGRAGGGAAAPSTSAGSAPSTAQVQALGRIVQLIGAAAAQPCSWLAIDGMSSQRLCAALACLLIDAAGLSIHPDVAAACGHVLALVGAASPGAMETAATELVAAVNGNYIALQQIVDRLPVTGGAAGDALRARVTLLGVRGLLEGKGFGGAKTVSMSMPPAATLDAMLTLFGADPKEIVAAASTATDASAPIDFWRLRSALLLTEAYVRAQFLRKDSDPADAQRPLERFYGFVKKLDKTLVGFSGNPRPSVRALRKAATYCFSEFGHRVDQL